VVLAGKSQRAMLGQPVAEQYQAVVRTDTAFHYNGQVVDPGDLKVVEANYGYRYSDNDLG
jgi:hypothetical protein